MPFVIGQNVGPYQIMQQLGQGGMATVYKAYHAALDRYVAIKVLHAAFLEDPSFTARFTREARVVAKLEHPNIVPIYDYSECDGQPYLVMKFIEGETLKARLARGPLSAEEAVRVIDAVGAALSYAHSKGILHRDIKPSNILLAPESGIYLADFGLARIAQSGESTLSSDMLLGTPHYISPEQAQGKKDLDAGTDIYSLGVVMYELAVGRVPFNADTPFSIIHDHIFTPLPMPRQINPKVPAPVERVLLKALSKNRADRYADVDSEVKAFRVAIRDAVTPPVQAPRASTAIKLPAEQSAVKKNAGGKKPPLWKRIPNWVSILTVVFLCGCLCLSALVVGGTLSERQHQRATLTAQAITPAPAGPGTTPEAVPPTEEATKEFAVPEDARNAWNLLQQGFAFLDQGNPDAAEKSFTGSLQAMPPGRAGVIAAAAQRLGARNQWIMAGKFCQKAGSSLPDDAALRIACEEVFFHVAEAPDGKEMLGGLADQLPQWSIAQAAYGRWLTAFSTRPADGEPYIHNAMTLARLEEKPIVDAVLGEYQCVTGQTDKGLTTLNSVLQDPITPPWLRVEAEKIIAKWQPK
jgi:tRNA A-37 threonylcarbamoyl transferase component Bud32/tetratricopeptide (TPR) repeat protein